MGFYLTVTDDYAVLGVLDLLPIPERYQTEKSRVPLLEGGYFTNATSSVFMHG